jgi:hypothetical protein
LRPSFIPVPFDETKRPCRGNATSDRLRVSDWARGSLSVGSSPERFADRFNQLVFVGELARLELGVELPAAHGKFEAASCGGNHDESTNGALVTRQKLGRQTDGLGFIVSKCAVFERDIHESSPYPVRMIPARPICAATSFASVIIVSCPPRRKMSKRARRPVRKMPRRTGPSLGKLARPSSPHVVETSVSVFVGWPMPPLYYRCDLRITSAPRGEPDNKLKAGLGLCHFGRLASRTGARRAWHWFNSSSTGIPKSLG